MDVFFAIIIVAFGILCRFLLRDYMNNISERHQLYSAYKNFKRALPKDERNEAYKSFRSIYLGHKSQVIRTYMWLGVAIYVRPEKIDSEQMRQEKIDPAESGKDE